MIRITYDAKTTLLLDQLVSFQGEAKTITRANLDKLKGSIRKHGFFVPVFVWQKTPASKAYIIDGHQRVKALEQFRDEGEEIPPIPVEYITAKTKKDAAEKLLAVTSQFGDFDIDGLALFGADYNLDDISFMDVRLVDTEFVWPEPKAEETEGDDDIPKDVEPITKTGDLWLLGEHRLLCGDATSEEDVARLMDGEKADMVFTDPPYGVDIQERDMQQADVRGRRKDGLGIQNDDLTGDTLSDFLRLAFAAALGETSPGACWYVCAPPGVDYRRPLNELAEIGVARHGIVWVKDRFVMGRCDYHYRHESIIYGWTPGAAHQPPPDRKVDTVWEFDRPGASKEHPTMKPVDLVAEAVGNSSKTGEMVLDPFLGSGTTVLACEKLNRKCYGLEIDPHYCDVIVQRYGDWCEANSRPCKVERHGQ